MSTPPAKRARVDDSGGGAASAASGNTPGGAGPSTDVDCGILEYISDTPGFRGILKQRYEDFHVSEVATDGARVQLLDKKKMPEEVAAAEPAAAAAAPEGGREELVAKLGESISAAQLEELVTLSGADLGKKKGELRQNIKKFVFLPCAEDKTERTAMHQLIKAAFPNLESQTKKVDGASQIKVSRRNSQTRGSAARSNGGFQQWPKTRPNHCKFVMHKANKGTMDAVFLLAKFLKTKTSRFSYAGTKDTRGVTTQLVTAKHISAAQLASLNPRLRGIHLGNFEYVREQINLGDLKGNHFQVVLRDIDAQDATVDAVMESVKAKGFINYFGMQRFGTGSVPTSAIGKAILLDQWSQAADMILGERAKDYDEVKEARRSWTKTRNARTTLELFPKKCTVERQLLQGLKNHATPGKAEPYNWIGGFRSISRNMRLMYVHAYQSLLWNKLVSARIKQHGMNVVPGDLILADKDDARSSCHPEDEQKIRVRVVTAEDVAANTYKITDVVMPLPGYAVVFPSNEVGEYCRQLLTEDGLEGYSFRHKENDYTLSGAYRHMCVVPGDVSWKVHAYTDEKQSLILSDADLLEGKAELPSQVPAGEGGKRALALAFTLPPSTYATMLVREVIKMPTDSNFQTSLNPRGVSGQTATTTAGAGIGAGTGAGGAAAVLASSGGGGGGEGTPSGKP